MGKPFLTRMREFGTPSCNLIIIRRNRMNHRVDSFSGLTYTDIRGVRQPRR